MKALLKKLKTLYLYKMKYFFIFIFSLHFLACESQQTKKEPSSQNTTTTMENKAYWKEKLTPQQYEVIVNKGTERPYTGAYWDHFEKGHYCCAACGQKLFTSDTKFESHCGWPSFDKAITGSVIYEEDRSFGMIRTEVMCSKCGGHLGHVFDDGPEETTGKRYCTNSISIVFVKE